jgi:hypothetical protein
MGVGLLGGNVCCKKKSSMVQGEGIEITHGRFYMYHIILAHLNLKLIELSFFLSLAVGRPSVCKLLKGH